MKKLELGSMKGFSAFNLGTGQGYSVFDVVNAFSKVSGRKITFEMAPRRDGDIAVTYASSEKAEKDLGWKAKRGLTEMCESTWFWQKNNPTGYATSSDAKV